VVIKDIAVLNQTVRPRPDDVKMLRFIAVEAVGEDRPNPYPQLANKEKRGRAKLPSTAKSETILHNR
jgi:hypothetical protein